jgi:hypothetical protein
MHDLIFQNQPALASPQLRERAHELGLDETTFDACLESAKYAGRINDSLPMVKPRVFGARRDLSWRRRNLVTRWKARPSEALSPSMCSARLSTSCWQRTNSNVVEQGIESHFTNGSETQ